MTTKTPRTRRTLTLGLATAALLGAATFGALRAHHSVRGGTAIAQPRGPEASAAEQQARADGPSLPARRWELGASFVYEVSTEGSASIKTGDGPAQPSSVKLSGTLALTVIARAGAGVTLRGDLRNGSFQQGGKALGAADLAAPFYAAATATGELSSFRFSKRLPAEARVALEALAASLQLVAPGSPRAAWQAREFDTTGLYEASYRLDGAAVHKRKVKYLGTRDGSGVSPFPASTAVTVQSTTDFEIDASGWPRTMAETESISMTWAEGLHVAGSSKSRATLATIEARPDLVAEGIERDATAANRDRAELRAANDRKLVGDKDFKQLAVDVRAKDTAARNRTQAQLGALFRIEPKAAAEAEDAILRGDLDDNGKKRLAAALGAAGTPEAQHALADVLGAQGAPAARRMDAAIALAQCKTPTPEAVAAIDQAMGSPDPGVASTATLASGAAVNQMNTGAGDNQDYAPTKDAVQKLIDGLKSAGDDQHRLVFLQALGNTGDMRAWPAIQPYLSSPSTTLRAAAAFDLRFLAGDPIDAAILAALTDPDAGVRRADVSTLPYRSNVLPLMTSLDTLMKTDPQMSVRLGVIEGLKFKLGDDDSVVELVKWAAEHDPASEVRNLARQVLAPPRS